MTCEDLDDIRINEKMPLKYYNMYSSFKIEKESYVEELTNILILSKPRELKLFFRNVNDRVKFLLSEFVQSTDLINDVKIQIVNELRKFIKFNLTLAKKYMKVEKEYTFKSDGPLLQDDL